MNFIKNIIYSINLFILFISISYSQSDLNITWFNFNDKEIDSRSELIVDLSEQISDKFIDIAKEDMEFIRSVNFISTDLLNKELKRINKEILTSIVPSFKENFSNTMNRDKLVEDINNISNSLSDSQTNFLADSIIILVEDATKNITIDMMDSEMGASNIAVSNLHDLIIEEASLLFRKSIFPSLMVSAKEDFETDVIVVGKYSIMDDEVNVDLFLYNYDDFTLIDRIHSKSFINKINILIKDLEFKLLTALGMKLNELQKKKLCEYNIENFSKKNYSLYFSNMFESNDIKEIKYRLQIEDGYDFLNNYYESFFNSLIGNKIKYKIKLYEDDNYYSVFATDSAKNNSVFIDVLRSNWFNEVGGYSAMESSNNSRDQLSKSKTIIEINYSNIESIYFYRGRDTFTHLIKQIAIYSSIIGSLFLLNLLI